MRNFNLCSIYDLGQKLAPLKAISCDTKKQDVISDLWWARDALQSALKESSALLGAARRAATALIEVISSVISENPAEAFNSEPAEQVGVGGLHIPRRLRAFESALANEMPSMPEYIVSKKGIYSTDDLISRAIGYFPLAIQRDVPEQARDDISEAGKCLAYEVPTACSFHLWRAVEETMCAYYVALSGKTVAEGIRDRNWVTIIKALEENNGAPTVTWFLHHIRASYRTPHTHPEKMVTMDAALSLFGAAASCINLQIMAIQELKRAPNRPSPATYVSGIGPV